MKLEEMYRVQSVTTANNGLNVKNLPVKRVLLSDDGKIAFNPNSDKYIYFSRARDHHLYYLYSRFFKMVKEELLWAKRLNKCGKYNLPDDFRVFTFHTNVNVDMLKEVKAYFKNCLPKKELEIVDMEYLPSYKNMLEECSTYNVKKKYSMNCPEISDPHVVSGAYGINEAWLDLLNSCIVQTKSAVVDFDYMFDYLIDTAYKGRVCRQILKNVLEDNPYLLDVTKGLAYKTLANPNFFAKDNCNKIVSSLEVIEEGKLYNQDVIKTPEVYFEEKKRMLKAELREVKSEMSE